MSPAPAHLLQLCDTAESVSRGISRFVADGLRARQPVVLLIRPAHWALVRAECAAAGIDVASARQSGKLTIHDAEFLVAELLNGDDPNDVSAERFEATIGHLVRSARRNGQMPRVFGEAVDVLARQNRLAAAERLEQHWNAFVEREGVTLLCSYSSEHFGDPRDALALRRICGLHAHLHTPPHDALARFLLRTPSAC